MTARCATEAFSTTCAVHIEDVRAGGCPAVVAQWQIALAAQTRGVLGSTPATAGFFTFLYFRLIISKFIYFQRDTR